MQLTFIPFRVLFFLLHFYHFVIGVKMHEQTYLHFVYIVQFG